MRPITYEMIQQFFVHKELLWYMPDNHFMYFTWSNMRPLGLCWYEACS